LAFRTNKLDEVLDLIDKFFSEKYGFNIGEIMIGNRKTKYTKGKKNFKDWQDYSERIELIRLGNNIDFYGDFDVFFDLKENKDWVVLLFSPLAGYGGYFHEGDFEEILRMLSKELGTTVLLYAHYDTTNFYHIMHFDKGIKEDELEIGDDEIYKQQGYFSQFEREILTNQDKFFKAVYTPFFQKAGFEPEADEFELMISRNWRRFYLDGDIDKLKSYLRNHTD